MFYQTMFCTEKVNVTRKMKIQTSVAIPTTNPIRNFFKKLFERKFTFLETERPASKVRYSDGI